MALAKRVALITGAARGIGKATAELFRAQGWHVVAVDIRTCRSGDRCMKADLSDPEKATGVIKSIADNEARLDALINNAAVQVCKPLDETTLAEWDKVMACNLRAPFWLMRESVTLLEKQHGAIVNVSSVHAVATSTEIGAYAASKGGLTALTRAAALEFAPRGVRVNAVLPGAVNTPMLREGLERDHITTKGDDPVAAFGAVHPMGRVARPDEIAQAILYLADGERSSYVTGQSHVVDGAVTVRLSTE